MHIYKKAALGCALVLSHSLPARAALDACISAKASDGPIVGSNPDKSRAGTTVVRALVLPASKCVAGRVEGKRAQKPIRLTIDLDASAPRWRQAELKHEELPEVGTPATDDAWMAQ